MKICLINFYVDVISFIHEKTKLSDVIQSNFVLTKKKNICFQKYETITVIMRNNRNNFNVSVTERPRLYDVFRTFNYREIGHFKLPKNYGHDKMRRKTEV